MLKSWAFNEYNEKCVWEKKKIPNLLFSIAELWYQGIDFNIGQLFKIHFDELVKIYYILSRDVHVSFSDFLDMQWFWVLMTVDQHAEAMKEQSENNDNQTNMAAEQQANMEAMFKQQQQSMPKFEQPKMPEFGQLGTNFNFNI